MRKPLLSVLVLSALATSCGPKVQTVETARASERDEDAEVLVFIRDRDGIPQCPWEVLGTIEVRPGWADDDGERRDVRRAAARIGGHAGMVETGTDEEARVLRVFDPLCTPVDD